MADTDSTFFCPHCGTSNTLSAGHPGVDCQQCGKWVHALSWRRLWAVEELQAKIRAQRDLPLGVGPRLLGELDREAAKLRVSLAAQSPEEEARPTSPPPIPARAPVPHRERMTRSERLDRVRERRGGSTVWERLGPAFAENLGFALAAFLIIAGAIFFTTTAWTTMNEAERPFVLVGGLMLLGGVLFAASRVLNRTGTLPEVERVLLLVVALLAPVAAVPAGNLLEPHVWRGLVAASIVFPAAFFVARRLGRILDPAFTLFLPAGLLVLSAPILVGGPAGRSEPVLAALVAAVLLVGVAVYYGRRVLPRAEARGPLLLWPLLPAFFASAVFAGRVCIAAVGEGHVADGRAVLGAITAASALALALVEPALARQGFLGRRSPAVLLAIVLALAVAGTSMAVGSDLGLLVAAGFGAWAALLAGFRLPGRFFVLPGLILAAVAYLYSPAPVRELALRLRDQATTALGYEGKLPLAWYGLTFLPYVAACGVAGWYLLRREYEKRAGVLLVWTAAVALGLAILSFTPFSDVPGAVPAVQLRAAASVLLAQGALLVALAFAVRRWWLAFPGTLGVYGGATCALLHWNAPAAVSILVLAGLGVAAVLLAALTASRPARTAPARAGLLDATAVLAVCFLGVGVLDLAAFAPAPSWHALGYVTLAALLLLLGYAYTWSGVIVVASVAWAAVGIRFVAGTASSRDGGVYVLVVGALSIVPLFTRLLTAHLPDAFWHPAPKIGGHPDFEDPRVLARLDGIGAVAAQAFVLVFLFLASPAVRTGLTTTFAAGLLAGAVVLFRASTRRRQGWIANLALVELVAAGYVAGAALGHETLPLAAPWLGVAVATALACLPLVFGRPRVLAARLFRPLGGLLPVFTAGLFIWAVALVVQDISEEYPAIDGTLLAIGAVLVAGVVRIVAERVRATPYQVAAVAGGLLLMPGAVALLDGFAAAPHVYPLVLLGVAVLTVAWAGRSTTLRATAIVPVVAAGLVATGVALGGEGSDAWLLVAFALVAAAGWGIAQRLAFTLGWTITLLAVLLGLSLVLLRRTWGMEDTLLTAVALTYATVVLLAARARLFGIASRAADVVAVPLVFGAGSMALALVAWVTGEEPPWPTGSGFTELEHFGYALIALVAATFAWSLRFGRAGRSFWTLLAIAFVAFLYAPANILVHGHANLWRPDIEVATLGALLALLLPLPSRSWWWPIGFAVAGLALTWGFFRDPSTPFAVLAVTVTLLVLLVRDGRRHLGHLFGLAVLGTALAFVTWLRPTTGELAVEPWLLLGAVAAVTAFGLLVASLSFRLRELAHTAVVGAGVAFGYVAVDVVLNLNRPASGLQVILAAVALGVPGIASAWGAVRTRRPLLLHLAVVAGLVFYVFVVQRTAYLSVLDGYHLHATAALGLGLLLAAGLHHGRLGWWLALDGLLLAAPAALVYTPVALGLQGGPAPATATAALALSGIASAAAARRLAAPALYGVAVALLNLMLFAFWRWNDLVDPAFYGVPPGLTLVAAATFLQRRIPRTAQLALLVPGLLLLYGSVGIQVFPGGNALHALVLFGLGFLTVGLGFVWKRNAWLVTGMAVIVLDSVGYLAAHGFETSFFAAALLVGAGLAVMAFAALTAMRRRKSS